MVAVTVLGLAGSGTLAQGVSFSGSAGMGVVYEGATKTSVGTKEAEAPNNFREETLMESRIIWDSDFDISIAASGTTDGGLTFGASTSIEAGQTGGVVTDSEVHIGGESWTVKIGELDPASHMGRSINDVGYNGLGVDDVAETIVGSTKSEIEVSFSLGAASLAITAGQNDGVARKGMETPRDSSDDTAATKEDSEWAAGVSFGIGSTTLGLGIDSEKLMQASISADLGAFGGSLFFAQQKTDGPTDLGADNAEGGEGAQNADTTHTNKLTGIGVEITVSAGANTTINAVYAQGKQSDVRMNKSDGAGLVGPDDLTTAEAVANPVAMTDKGFGVGVSHNLGGGATLQAGFAKVKKQTKASVGVSMSF